MDFGKISLRVISITFHLRLILKGCNMSLITIVFDNNIGSENLKAEWGFACVIKTDKNTILFDTGSDGDILLSNMKQLNINPKDIDTVVISHYHYDHADGLPKFLEQNSNVKVFVLGVFPQDFKDLIKEKGATLFEVKDSMEICSGVISTGELEGKPCNEQSLIIDENKPILITGCAHPGILEIIKESKKLINKDIFVVIGGFHLFKADKDDIDKVVATFKEEGIKFTGPCHCSGDNARAMFKEKYKENYLDVFVGKVINI